MESKCIDGDNLKTKDYNFQTTSKYDYASAYNKSFLTFLLERIFLISVGLIMRFLLFY